MPDTSAGLTGDLRRGDHACLVCESDGERWGAVSDFVREGLRQGERTLYVATEHDEREVRERLDLTGAPVGELIVAPASEAMSYGPGIEFDYVDRVAGWREQVRAAVTDGFAGLRVAADMAWTAEAAMPLGDVVDYERLCTGVITELPAVALCVYDRRRFDDHTVARAGHAHPICRGAAVAPAAVFSSRQMKIETAGPGALRLAGEVDLSNVPALASALRSAVAERDALLIDLSALDFIDVAGMRTIQEAACRLAGRGGELVLLSPRPVVSRLLSTLGMDRLVTLDKLD